MGQEDVLVEVIINGKEMLQFYSTKENYKTLYEGNCFFISLDVSQLFENLLLWNNFSATDQ